jgi:hypothetical protein
MFGKSTKISQSMIDAVNKVLGETKVEEVQVQQLDEAQWDKVKSKTGTKVYGSSYGNSVAARKHQTSHEVDSVKGPKSSELGKIEKDPENYKKQKDHPKNQYKRPSVQAYFSGDHKIPRNEEFTFADALLAGLKENKANGPQETFTDNNLGEGEQMTDKQMAKREKIVMSMKDKQAGFKQRYGKNWKNVMYATATKQAMAEEVADLDEAKKMDDATRDLLIHAHTYATNKVHKRVMNGGYKDKAEMAIHHAQELNHALSTLGRGEKLKEDVELDESDVTTDMLRGRVEGGKSNAFKPFKLKLKSDGEMKAPGQEQPTSTTARNSINTNGGQVVIKPGQVVAKEEAKHDDEKEDKELIKKMVKKDCMKEEDATYFIEGEKTFIITEEKPEHTHVAHYEDKDGNWMAKLLINAPHDGHAIEHANKAIGSGPFKGLNVRKIERVTKIMEEVKKADIPAWLRKKRGDTPLTVKDVKGASKDSISHPDNLAKARNEEFELDEGRMKDIATNSAEDERLGKETSWVKSPKNVKDKSGAVHTPMSRAKDLARLSFAKIKKEVK